MNFAPSSEIHERTVPDKVIDFSRPFMPHELTPFYHAPGYLLLSEPQRLRYNQLHALYFNEQTMFFEKALARNILGYFIARPLPIQLKSGLRQFMNEEGEHSAMFRGLNLKCAPRLYSHQDFYFIRVPSPAASLLDVISKRPQWFPLLLWLMHLQEERALFFGRTFLKCADSLEPHFVATQRKHVADEIGHIRWDETLLDWVWPKTGLLRRQLNTRILAWMIEEYFSTPKRAALRVLQALLQEFPELQPQYAGFCTQFLDLGKDPGYRRSLYCQENVPKTFKRFDAWKEFQPLAAVMPGYIPGANA
jgi:hypothetical protein